jgi:hypothetical protein
VGRQVVVERDGRWDASAAGPGTGCIEKFARENEVEVARQKVQLIAEEPGAQDRHKVGGRVSPRDPPLVKHDCHGERRSYGA